MPEEDAQPNAETQQDIDARIKSAIADLIQEKVQEAEAPAQAAPRPTKEWTRAELNAKVAVGELTESDADRILERQIERRVVSEVAVSARIDTDMEAYQELRPEAFKNGTNDRRKVVEEYQYLVRAGSPQTRATELAALRAAFGPLARLRSAAAEPRRETHREGGGDGGGTAKPEAEPGVPKDLTDRQKTFYKYQIEQGRYRDWTEVAKEVEFVRARKPH